MLNFVLMGLLGGLTYVLFSAEERRDLYSFDAFRRYALGLIMGYIYSYMHSDWNYPNAVTSFVYGLSATFIIENILERVKRKPTSPSI